MRGPSASRHPQHAAQTDHEHRNTWSSEDNLGLTPLLPVNFSSTYPRRSVYTLANITRIGTAATFPLKYTQMTPGATENTQPLISNRHAPVPMTPHSQTATPSPSPSSPDTVLADKANLFSLVSLIPTILPPFLEQVVKQWQIFAQNNRGDVTDSTLSPSPPKPHPYYWLRQLSSTSCPKLRLTIGFVNFLHVLLLASPFSSCPKLCLAKLFIWQCSMLFASTSCSFTYRVSISCSLTFLTS